MSGWAHCWVLRDRATESFSGWGLLCGGSGLGLIAANRARVVCRRRCRWVACPYVENCIVDASILNTHVCVFELFCGQVSKGARWMPRYQEPMKDVGGCDKPRGAVNQAVIRGCPNGETQLE